MNTLTKQNDEDERIQININDLADIRDVEIDQTLSKEERQKSYLRQIKNPHLYRCGDTIVRVSFTSTGVTLEDRLKQYLLSGQGLALL
jgi:hypothetical protein